MIIVGIVGTLGAGKGTVVEYLTQRGFRHYSASGLLKELVLAEGQQPSRDTYSPMAKKIRTAYPGGLAQLIWKQVEADAPDRVVIEALHDIGEAQFVKDKGGFLLGVDADIQTRYERVVGRGSEKDNISFEHFKEQVAREEEAGGGHNIRGVLKMADQVVMNNGSKEELETAVAEVLSDILK